MSRTWEINDNKVLSSDLVREQDFILRIRRLQRLGTPHLVVNLVLNNIEALTKNLGAKESVDTGLKEFAKITNGVYADMSNGDVFIIWEGNTDSKLLADRLLSVMLPVGHSLKDAEKYLNLYYLPRDYTLLRERANYYVEAVRTATVSGNALNDPSEALKSEAARGPLTAWSVDQISKLLQEINLNHYARTQPIFELGADHQWTPVREEYFVSFEDLRRERFPRLDIITPEHLFLALCEIIDQQLLTSLNRTPAPILGRPMNINLAVSTLTGVPFAQFTHKIPQAQHSLICVEIHRGDLFQDFARTMGVIEALKQEQFKVALDSIAPDVVGYINLKAFGVDYIKINVAKERARLLKDPAVLRNLRELDPSKIIFYRCDSEAALDTGKELGVKLFQGWMIDDMVHGRYKK